MSRIMLTLKTAVGDLNTPVTHKNPSNEVKKCDLVDQFILTSAWEICTCPPIACEKYPMICCMTCSVALLKALVVDMQMMQFGLKEVDNYQSIVCIEVDVVFIQMSETASSSGA